MKTKTRILFFVLLGFSVTMAQEVINKNKKVDTETTLRTKTFSATETAEDSIVFKDGSDNHLITITDEGTVGSIRIPSGISAPSTTTNKLYNVGNTLFFNGNPLLGSGGATSLNDLSDARYIGYSLFLGYDSGVNDDGSNNYNTAVGESALYTNTAGDHNTAIGQATLVFNTTGKNNTAIGAGALLDNLTGNDNTATGMLAIYTNSVGSQNTADGFKALYSNTTSDNTAIGYSALTSNTTGGSNTATGSQALYSNTTASNNTADGFKALYSNTAGDNTAIGYSALTSNTTGSSNTAAGSYSLFFNTEGSSNTANGYSTLYSNTTGTSNTANGSSALHSNSTGSYNTANGSGALQSNTTGSWNTANGDEALLTNTGGGNNSATGYSALTSNTSGGYNTSVGSHSLYSNTIGNYNTCIGYGANYNNEEGSNNTIIGNQAGYGTSIQNITGDVFLGYQAGYYETGDNKLYIENSNSSSPLIWGDFSNDRVVINGNSTDNTQNRTFFVNGSAGGTGGWFNDSDIRLKKNVKIIPDALKKVNELRGVNFEWKDQAKYSKGMQMGFIAQEVEKVIPEVVDTSGDHYTMQYAPVTALLVEAAKEEDKIIKEQKKTIEAQQEELNALKEEVARIEKELSLKKFASVSK